MRATLRDRRPSPTTVLLGTVGLGLAAMTALRARGSSRATDPSSVFLDAATGSARSASAGAPAATTSGAAAAPATPIVAEIPEGVDVDAPRTGDESDRGQRSKVGLDMEKLRDTSGFEPVVQYLTYVQSRRGDESHLLFVRDSDLNQIAGLSGGDVDMFVERLDRLGVLVSNN